MDFEPIAFLNEHNILLQMVFMLHDIQFLKAVRLQVGLLKDII